MRPINYIYIFMCALLFGCTGKDPIQTCNMNPSDPQASELLKVYHQTLCSRLSKGIMLGHQNALAYSSMWLGDEGRSDVKSIYGEDPILVGWNLSKIGFESSNSDSISFSEIRKHAIELDKAGGVTTFTWNPGNITIQNETSLTALLSEEKGYTNSLDSLANFLIELKNDNGQQIPIILKMFTQDNSKSKELWHFENCNAGEYKKLWNITVNYLRKQKEIHHVLYAYSIYSPTNEDDFSAYYPGDNYVDIVGLDLYLNIEHDNNGAEYKKQLDKNLAFITQFANERNKIPSLTETGLKGVKISNFFSAVLNPVVSKYKISYIMFGRNAWNMEEDYYIPIPGHPATDDFLKFVSEPYILIGDKIIDKS